MAKMPEETRQKISDGNRRAWASPAVRQRMITAIKGAWTPARRQAMSRERRAFWRQRREAKAAAKLEAESHAP
jgi:hypothetical protein